MKCFKCGKELTGNSRFCFYCGQDNAPDNAPDLEKKEYTPVVSSKEKNWWVWGICLMVVILIGAPCIQRIQKVNREKREKQERIDKNVDDMQKAIDQITKWQESDELSVTIWASADVHASYEGNTTWGYHSVNSDVDFKDGKAHAYNGKYSETISVYGEESEFESFLTSDGKVITSKNSDGFEEIGSADLNTDDLLSFFDDYMKTDLIRSIGQEYNFFDIDDDTIKYEFSIGSDIDGVDSIYQNYINYLSLCGVEPEEEYNIDGIGCTISVPRKSEDEVLRISFSFPDVEYIWFGYADDGLEFSSVTGNITIIYHNRDVEDFTIPAR